MKIQNSATHILAITAMTFAIAPAMAQGTSAKTDMPPISGNVHLPAGQQNQVGGPMGETGTTLPQGMPAARTPEPVRTVVQAPAPVVTPAPVTAPAPAAAPAPAPAPIPAPPVRRARADRG